MELKPDFNRFLAAVRHKETTGSVGRDPDRLFRSKQIPVPECNSR